MPRVTERLPFSGYSPLETISFSLLLLLAATAAIPRGGVAEGGALFIEVMAFVAAALSLLSNQGQKLRAGWLPVAALLAIAAVGGLQLLPLGDAAVTGVAPAVGAVWTEANAVLRTFDRPAATSRLTIAPRETARTALLICAYAALFVATVRLSRTRPQRRALLIVFAAACLVQIVFATFERFGLAGDEMVPAGRLRGTFVNPNHFAGYLEICLALLLAPIWVRAMSRRRRPGSDRKAALERRLVLYGVVLLAWIFVAGAIALTESRMGMVAAGVTTVLLVILASTNLRGRSRRASLITVAVVGVATAISMFAVSGSTFWRFLALDPRDPESEARVTLWKISLDTWRESPHLGFGLGSFRDAFRRVQSEPLGGVVEEAHNDTLQLLVTGGWISVTFAVLATGSLLFLLLRGWRRQEHREESTIALVSAGALISLLIHGIAEFNFSIPAIPATLAIILGVGWSAAMYQHAEPRSPEGL